MSKSTMGGGGEVAHNGRVGERERGLSGGPYSLT